jgi:hypothetical protein
MGDNLGYHLPSRKEERRFVKEVAHALHADSPNPGRIDCPGSDAVRAVVKRRVTFPEFDDIVDHIATCAPCFADYSRRRNHYVFRRATIWALCGSAVLLCLFLKFWTSRAEEWAHNGNVIQTEAVLDYKTWTVNRSDESREGRTDVPSLPRSELEVTIKLPIGTEDGAYQVTFRPVSGKSLREASGNAIWDGRSESLRIRADLRGIPAGNYTVDIRSAKGSSRSYPVLLK